MGDGRNKLARRCHERTPHRAFAHFDWVVGRVAGASGVEMGGKPSCWLGRHCGGAERTVWETLFEMERVDYRAGAKDPRAITLVLDLAKAPVRASLPDVWAWTTQFIFPRHVLRVLCGYFEHQKRVQFEKCFAEQRQTITENSTDRRAGVEPRGNDL